MPQIKFLDRAKETTSTTGSGTVTLGGASAGFVPLSGIGSGNYSYYVLEEAGNFEIGQGTYSSVGNTFSRDTILSTSNSDDSKINLGGTARIFLTYPSLFLNQLIVGSGDGSIKLGPNAGVDSNGTASVSIGPSAGIDSTGHFRVSIGSYAGASMASSYGNNDVSIGHGAGFEATGITPGSNVHIGYLAGYLSDGRNSVHIAESAGQQQTSNYGISLGYYAGSEADGDENIFIGRTAGYNSNGDENVFIGRYAGQNSAGLEDYSGDQNVNIGKLAGYGATSGDNNLYIGLNAGRNTQGNNNIEVVAAGAGLSILNGSNLLHIGNTIVGDTDARRLAVGLVGAGDFSPDATIEIKPSGTATVGLIVQAAASHTANLAEFQDASETNLVTIDAGGATNVSGLLTAATGVALQRNTPATTTDKLYNVSGSLYFNGSGVGGGGGTTYTAGSGLQLNGTTFDALTATTSASGITQLQDSATDGTINRAITPNAVYDISGVLAADVASTGTTNAAAIATNATNIATNVTNIAATGATLALATGVNQANIATNTTNIATNVTNIAATGATLALATGVNQANIATNTTNIATNVTNIAATGASNYNLVRSYVDTSDNATFNNLTAQGNLTVSGTLTYLDSTTVTIADKQLELASNSGTAIGNDSAVNDGGIVVKSTDSDKKWTWLDATDAWHSTENISLASSKSLIFGDSTTQTTSATGDISTVSGLTVTNATNIASTGATNAAAIATNVTNIATNATNIASTGATNAAAAATNATNIATNVTNIASTGATNAAAAATNATNIATNVTNIAATGATNAAAIVTNTTNIASTGATNAADIDTVSGLIQTYTANTGLVLVGNEFNTAGTGHFDSVAIATDGYIYHSGDDNTYMQFGDDQITFYAGNKSMLKLDEDTTDRVIINNGTVDIDLQVKGDNDSNLLRTDAANDRVGIGTDEPAYKLDVDGVGSFESGVVTSGLITAATGVELQRNTPATTTDKLYNVGGALYFNGSAVDGDTTYTANTGLTLVGTEFNTANTGYFDRLGIGTGVLTPTYELDVAGNVGVDEYIYHNGDSNTYMQFGNDQITFFAGNQEMLYFDGDPVELGSVIINNGATDVDFIVKGDIDSNLLRTVTATDRIGIGTSSPAYKLDVAGTGSFASGVVTSGLITAATGVELRRNTPATTTDKLYNVGGALYFNGSAVDGDTTYTAGSGLQLNGTTFDALSATTSASGITQLQDSATDGTTDKAITPNAVYDISGVLAADVASTGTTNAAAAATNATNIATNVTNIAATGATLALATGVNQANIATNTTNIATNVTNIAATGATNSAAIVVNTDAITATTGNPNNQVVLGANANASSNLLYSRVSIGQNAGSLLLAGGRDGVFIGYYAGRGATGGERVAIGDMAGDHISYGGAGGGSVHCVDIGYFAGRAAPNHDYGVCVGSYAGNLMDGDRAIAVGMLSMYNADNCADSIGIGPDAGRASNGEKNIFIGKQAGENCVGSNNIEILTDGASTSILDDHSNAIHIENTIMGSTDSRRLAIGLVVAGDEAPDATLEIKPSGTATVGLIIQAESSHTANLTEWQNSSETVLAYVDKDGSLSGNAMTLAGHLAANTKSFLIDHPTKEGKKLQYASLEGPEHGVYVRGYTDVNIISLPDYWTELVDKDSLTVQLTPKDFAQPNLFVSGILDNKVYLQSDGDTRWPAKISSYYTINAIRKDVDPLEVEI